MAAFEFARGLYPYTAQGEDLGLPFSEGTVLNYLEDRKDGWSRGATGTQEGWFPTSYVAKFSLPPSVDPLRLAAVVRSTEWKVFATTDHKLYFVSKKSQETTWTMPSIPVPQSLRQRKLVIAIPVATEAVAENGSSLSPPILDEASLHREPNLRSSQKSSGGSESKPKRTQQTVIGGITFPETAEGQKPLCPGEAHYCDYFWGDCEIGTGYDVTIQKNVTGKNAIKEMGEFIKERAAIEDQYARGLQKLSKSVLGSQEEGTLRRAWLSIKSELADRSKTHATFAANLLQDVERPMLEHKDLLKQAGREHIPVLEQNRRQLRELDAAMERAKVNPNPPSLASGRRSTKTISSDDIKNLDRKSARKLLDGEDVGRILQVYNETQSAWMDNMIQALQEMEQQEEGRLDFLKKLYQKYIELNIQVNEDIALALQRVNDAVDHTNAQADRDLFIQRYSTGQVRPVDRQTSAEQVRR